MKVEGWAVLFEESGFSFSDSVFVYPSYLGAVASIERAKADKKIRKTLRFDVPVYVRIERLEESELEVREREAALRADLETVEESLDIERAL